MWFLQSLIFGPLPQQLSGSLYLYPYCPWYIQHSPYSGIFFLLGLKIFLYLVARGWVNFKFLGDPLYWKDLISFLGEGDEAIFLHRAISDQSCKLKNSWWQNYLFHVVMLTFLIFAWKFSVWEFSFCSSVHSNSQKKCLLLFGINCAKVWILLNLSSE